MKKADRMLFEGIKKNDLRKVALALNLGANVNVKDNDNDGDSLLSWAARRDNVAIAKLLISAGADVNVKDNDGDSPLFWARSEEMKELLQGVTP